MSAVVGPVVVREAGYAFDIWTPEKGLLRGFRYPRVEQATYARRVEIGARAGAAAVDTIDEFDAALAALTTPEEALPIAA
jgi:hypothetical protein